MAVAKRDRGRPKLTDRQMERRSAAAEHWSARCRQVRAHLGDVSQAALAAMLGISKSAVAAWEQGTRVPSAERQQQLDAMLGGKGR
jgi:DNA-binding transcriptional regulator YiaG